MNRMIGSGNSGWRVNRHSSLPCRSLYCQKNVLFECPVLGYTVFMKPKTVLVLILVLSIGCDSALEDRLPIAPAQPERASHADFDPDRCGALEGRIAWTGERPKIDPLLVSRFTTGKPLVVDQYPHPNAPNISGSNGLGSALVSLKGIDLARSKPMAPKSVRVELDEAGIMIVDADQRKRAVWLPIGSDVTLVNRIQGIGGIRVRGAAFFGQMFPEFGGTSTRALNQPGWVHFTSASGQYWASADLYVSEHGYVALTDETGQFRMEQVPDGEYDLIAWHPNWHVIAHELDPETGVRARQSYGAPAEIRTRVRITAGDVTSVKLAFSASDFPPTR